MKKNLVFMFFLIFLSCSPSSKEVNNEEPVQSLANKDSIETKVSKVQNNKNEVNQIEEKKVERELSETGKYKEETIFDNQVRVLIPEEFELMGEDMRVLKYPRSKAENIVVFTDVEGEVNFAFEKTSNVIQENNLEAFFTPIVSQFKSNAVVDLIDSSLEKVRESDFGYLEFYSQAVDTRVYNFMFVTPLKGKALTGSFNCTVNRMDTWKEQGVYTIKSIQIL